MKTTIKKIGFPFKTILLYIGFGGSFIALFDLLYYVGSNYGYKLFNIVTLLFYPISIAYFIYCGVKTGEWISPNNIGIAVLVFGVGSLVFLIPFIILVRRFNGDRDDPILFAQFIAAIEVGFIIAVIYDLYKVLL